MQTKKTNKTAQVAIASTLGLALLVGGSTYALWSANAPVNSAATITTGDLQVTSASAQQWSDISTPATPVTIPSLSGFAMVPGDTFQLKQDLNVVVVGNNISGKLKVAVPNNSASAAILAQAKFKLRLLDKDGNELASVTPSVNTLSSLEVNAANLPQTTSAGDLYTVELTVSLPESSDNDTKLQVAELGNAIVTLEQGGLYQAAPTITTLAAPTGAINTAYSLSLDGAGSGATYEISAGSLPAGVAIDPSSGVISGTPTAVADSTFTVKKTTANGSATHEYTISIMPVAAGVTIAVDTYGYGGDSDGLANEWAAAQFKPNTWSADQSAWARWMIAEGHATLTTSPDLPTIDYSTSADDYKAIGNDPTLYKIYQLKVSDVRYVSTDGSSPSAVISPTDARNDIVMSADGQTLIGFLNFSSYAATSAITWPTPSSYLQVTTETGQIIRTNRP